MKTAKKNTMLSLDRDKTVKNMSSRRSGSLRSDYIAFMGVMLALAAALSALESHICAAMPFGIRIGLANIIVMFTLMVRDARSAFCLVILKSLFVFLTRGMVAGIMSLCGGGLSFALICLLYKRTSVSVLMMSVLGGIMHNCAQLGAAYLLYRMPGLVNYLPLLAASGLGAGIATGSLLALLLRTDAAMKLRRGGQ